MQVWNVLHATLYPLHDFKALYKYCIIIIIIKNVAKSQSVYHCITLSGYIFATQACIDNRKKSCPHVLTVPPTNGRDRFGSLGHPQQISTGFASWLCHYSDVVHRRPTKLCTMFARLIWAGTLYMPTFSGAFAPRRNFAMCKLHFATFASKYGVLNQTASPISLFDWAAITFSIGHILVVYIYCAKTLTQLQCGPMSNVMAALLNIGGVLCSTPQRLADAHYQSAVTALQ